MCRHTVIFSATFRSATCQQIGIHTLYSLIAALHILHYRCTNNLSHRTTLRRSSPRNHYVNILGIANLPLLSEALSPLLVYFRSYHLYIMHSTLLDYINFFQQGECRPIRSSLHHLQTQTHVTIAIVWLPSSPPQQQRLLHQEVVPITGQSLAVPLCLSRRLSLISSHLSHQPTSQP